MDRFDQFFQNHRLRSIVLVTALLGAACGPPQIAKPPAGAAEPGGPAGGPAPPAFNLPDAAPTAGDGGAPAVTPPSGGACVGVAEAAESGPVDLLLLIDNSASMGSQNIEGRSRLDLAQVALSAFIRDPDSRGLGVGLQFFPAYVTKPCTTDQDCAGVADLCQGRSACPAANPVRPGHSCKLAGDQLPTVCAGGAACVATGACAGSGAMCTNLGQPCPGGAGTCLAFVRTCMGHNREANGCKAEEFREPGVPIGLLPDARDALLTAVNARMPFGATPMGGAAGGAMAYLKEHRMANPGRRAVLVIVTDGMPSGGCRPNTVDGVAEILAGGVATSPSVRTYVIGMYSAAEAPPAAMLIDQLASAGGTDKGILLTVNQDFTRQLQDALNQVRGSLGCEYQIPKPPNGGLIDFGKVNFHYTSGAVSEDIPYVESRDRCDPARGGWFYDVPPASGAPTRIVTCDATCTRLKATEMGKVDVVFGCGTRGID